MDKNKHSMVAVFFILSWLSAAVFAFFFVYLYIQNKDLRTSIAILEDKTFYLLEEGKQYQQLKSLENNLQKNVLDYMEWRYVVKEQSKQANQRLNEAVNTIKDYKKDKDLLNLIYYNLGLSNILSQDYNGAIGAFEKALQLKASDAWSYYDLGLLYSITGQNAKKVAQYYNKYLELDPGGIYANDVKERLEGLKTQKGKSR
jgi:tetratricopeptide (TPR) repeat protein